MSEERAYGISAALTARSRGLTSYGQLLRIAAATTVSYLLALHLSGSPLPVFAPITTLSVVQASPFSTLASTAQRVLGTALGSPERRSTCASSRSPGGRSSWPCSPR